ncbi:MAG: hypothetical protein ACREID_03605, partial [Planctomycetota bacterium]
GADSPAVDVPRGTEVLDPASGISGALLSDLRLPAGKADGDVYALSNARVPARGGSDRLPFFDYPPVRWEIHALPGVPSTVNVRSGEPRWYRSDLPVPPGYVSTSQWISAFVALAGAGVIFLSRSLRRPGARDLAEADSPG